MEAIGILFIIGIIFVIIEMIIGRNRDEYGNKITKPETK